MPSTTTWTLEPHTAAKHRLLHEYLNGWIPILGRWEEKVCFLDAFAGPGQYADGEPGSPIVALETLLDHARFPALRCHFHLVFIEVEHDRCEHLQATYADFVSRRGGLPGNVHVQIVEATFRDVAEDILSSLQPSMGLIPVLALIDPFGFSGAPIELIRRLLAFNKCEVMFNFMFDSVNRFATAGNVDSHYEALFGCSDYRKAPAKGAPRKEFLRSLYDQQLHTVGGFTHTRSFEMVNSRRRTGNYIFFGTRNPVGLAVMKQAMWKVDPVHGHQFRANEQGVLSLFDDVGPDLTPLRAQLLRHFGSRRVTIEDVETFVNLETDFLANSHLKTKTLRPMEDDGLIINVEGRQRPRTYPAGCTIEFVEK